MLCLQVFYMKTGSWNSALNSEVTVRVSQGWITEARFGSGSCFPIFIDRLLKFCVKLFLCYTYKYFLKPSPERFSTHKSSKHSQPGSDHFGTFWLKLLLPHFYRYRLENLCEAVSRLVLQTLYLHIFSMNKGSRMRFSTKISRRTCSRDKTTLAHFGSSSCSPIFCI